MRVRTRGRELALQFLFQLDFQGAPYLGELGAFLDEVQVFPEGSNADQVDAASLAFGALTGFMGARAATNVSADAHRRPRDAGRLFRPSGRVRLRQE